jgi:hypothetical protein
MSQVSSVILEGVAHLDAAAVGYVDESRFPRDVCGSDDPRSGACFGPSGAIVRGRQIDQPAAVARRKSGRDVVVCGDDGDANRRLAFAVESAVGPCKRGAPHTRAAGPEALPPYQQTNPPPLGHTFYETEHRKARIRS